jgi:endonuclease YncB( thermonuclease family)
MKAGRPYRLADLETQARAAKRGLWAGKSPVAPWVFRAEKARKQRERKLQRAG